MNSKAIALGIVGILLMSINIVVISPMVMDQTQSTISEKRHMTNDTWEDVGWLNSTSERSFFAWNLNNANELQQDDDAEMEFEKMGPFTYNLTTKREVLFHDETAGTLTYREYNVYDWCEDCIYTDENGTEHASMSGDTELTNLNILFNAQKIGAVGTAIDTGSLFVKGAYTRDMLYFDLSERAPSIWVSDDISSAGEEAMRAEIGWGSSETDNTTLNHVLYDAKDPGDSSICIALTCDIGTMLMIRGGAPDNGTNSIARATMFGYVGVDDAETFARDHAIYNAMSARFAAHGGGAVLESASMDDLNDRLEEMSGYRIEHEATLQNLLFSEGEGGVPTGLLVCDERRILCGSTDFLQKANPDGGDPFALRTELTVSPTEYTFSIWALQEIGAWAGDWFLSSAEYEMILSGGSGKIDADQWFWEAFGSVDPINQEYIALGLNVGSEELGAPLWSTVYGNELIDLEPEVTAGLFSGPHSITGNFAMDIMYGEIMGFSVPMDENFIPTAGGEVHVWDDALVAQIYGLDNNSASALRWLFSFTVFDTFLEPLLDSFLGVVPYRTQSVNQWLFGWEDPLSDWVSLEKNASYFGCEYDFTQEYINSTSWNNTDGDGDGILNKVDDDDDGDGILDENDYAHPYGFGVGDGIDTECWTDSTSVYSVYTGVVGDVEPGQIIAEDGDVHLPWRTPSRNTSAYGMLDPVVQTNSMAGKFPADRSVTMNLGGYTVATSEILGKGSVHGVETYHHRITIDPLDNPIQAKLINDESILDIFPGALPVYFGGTVEMQVEPNVNAAIAGEMTSYFYLDTRGIGAIDPTIDDLQPVFQISESSSATEADAEFIKNSVITNLQPYSYWTNFDGADASFIDEITLLIWVLGIVSLLGCSVTAKLGSKDEREVHFEEE